MGEGHGPSEGSIEAPFEWFTGNTANFVAAEGGPTSNLRALVGLKLWF